MNCFICQKHKGLPAKSIIVERGSLLLTHFPILDGALPTKGYLLIETKRHIVDLTEMNKEESEALGFIIRDGTALIRSHLKAEHVYLFRINDVVPHLHFHLVPRYEGTPKEFWGTEIRKWTKTPKVTGEEIDELSHQMSKIVKTMS